jgi:hypothetical protein
MGKKAKDNPLPVTHVRLLLGQAAERERVKLEENLDKKWRQFLKEAQSGSGDSHFWDGREAVQELTKHKYFEDFQTHNTEQGKFFWNLLVREVVIHKSVYRQWIRRNSEFKRLVTLLEALIRKLEKFSPDISRFYVKDLIEELRSLIPIFIAKQEQFRQDVLYYTPEELSRPLIPVEAIDQLNLVTVTPRDLLRAGVKREYMADNPDVPELDFTVSNWKIPEIKSRRNLDTRLQLRLAALIKLYYPKLTWLTVCRLVLLAYLSAELARKKGKYMHIYPEGSKPSKARLTVDHIFKNVDKLRSAQEPDFAEYMGIKE